MVPGHPGGGPLLYSEQGLFHTTITSSTWDESIKRWIVKTDRGDDMKAKFVMLANGILAGAYVAYKLLRELGGATAVGPILVGLPHPVNALALGATVDDVVNMAAITVNQVITRGRNQ